MERVGGWVGSLPTSEAELVSMRDNGLLRESHHMDLKERLSSKPKREANVDLAKDFASFSIDGGVLYLGVAEVKGAEPNLTPIDLTGVRERLDQIAQSIPQPPISLRVEYILSETSPDLGYGVVVIPQSAEAPHMV